MVTTTMQKYGNSYAIYIPSVIMDKMPFLPDELVELTIKGDRVIIKNKR
jgi:antitoxin component of MazEF toxin-antitoxin module